MRLNKMRRVVAGVIAGILMLLTGFLHLPVLPVQGAVVFGDLEYQEKLVEQWDALAAEVGLERTDLQNHYTSTYPKPKVIASVKQQTGRSAGGRWKDWEYRNVYCISHSDEAANDPVSSMVCSSAWYAGEPWTLQNLPEYMEAQSGGDAYRLRFNFLMLAYGAGYRADQGGVNSDSIVGTADYYLCQGICTLTEDLQFTGCYETDWGMYEPIVMDWASRFHPNGNGSSRVYEDMKANAKDLFDRVWNTAKLTAACTQSGEEGFLFQPSVSRESDGMFHTRFPMVPEIRPILAASAIRTQGDWQYRLSEDAVDFWSPSGEIPSCGYLAEMDPSRANGIIDASIGAQSVRELHQPVQIRGIWSLTYAQANLVSSLNDGIRIVIGAPGDQVPSFAPGTSGGGSVRRYRHTERWQADYEVALRKLDAETGQPLEGARFDILEAFDSSQLDGSILEDDNWENEKGSQFLRWEGWDAPYEEHGDEPCRKDQEITDAEGWLTEMESAGAGPLHMGSRRAHHDVKYYAYTKGYCGGHPEPDPDDEEEEEEYEREIAVCEALAAAGGFFHDLDGAADQLRADRDRHYREFVSLTYDYSARELTARDGYVLHNQEQVHEPNENIYDGIHRDTVPVETVTIHASQYYGQVTEIDEEPVPRGPQIEIDEDIPDEDEFLSDEMFCSATSSDAASAAMSSDAVYSAATSSDAVWRSLPGQVLTVEDRRRMAKQSGKSAGVLRDGISWSASPVSEVPKADAEYGGKGSAWTFAVYDHRTEGEVHINKRDLTLKQGESEVYDSYGDTQGDTTLEGAVYGLFAAEDIRHPDGKTGIVYQKGDLTAVAATDRNGDASFLVYTEPPGSVYDYAQGRIVSTGFSGPVNRYTADFEQHTSNEAVRDGQRWSYPIRNLEEKYGNCWIGRPLILGSYYVQELARSEGYELSVYGVNAEVTNRSAWENHGDVSAKGEVWLESVEEQMLREEEDGKAYLTTQLTFAGRNAVHGYDIVLKGLDPAMGPSFYTTGVENREVFAQWQEPSVFYEAVEAESGTRVIINGNSVEASPGDSILLPNGEAVTAEYVETGPVSGAVRILTGEHGYIPMFDQKYVPELTGVKALDEAGFVARCNEAFLDIGLIPVGAEAPYLLIELGGTMEEWPSRIYEYLQSETCPCFNGASLERVITREGQPYAVLRYSFLKEGSVQPVLYSAGDRMFYVKYDVLYRDIEDDSMAEGYLYRAYPAEELDEEDYEIGNRLYRWIRIVNEKPERTEAEPYEPLSELQFVSAQEFRSYWIYGPGDFLRREDGSIYQKEYLRYENRSGYHKEECYRYAPLEFAYKESEKAYTVHIAPERIAEDGKLMISIRYEDVFAGSRSGLSVSASPSMDVTGTYIRPVVLTYPGQEQSYEDAGTRKQPVSVEERAVIQKVSVMKTVENPETDGAEAMGNFRFKIYLKSNLERLYRDREGNVIWMNRDGQELSEDEQREKNKVYPGLVPVIDTRKGDSGDSGEAAEFYTLLENGSYDKFFGAMAAANHDKWDDAAPTYTSWHPIGNRQKRSVAALENARVSDAVRQFAIDWYLDDEVKKLKKEPVTYTDEIYEEALNAAIQKAGDYLKPFYAYDLDEIYAIQWDSDAGGGNDRDAATLSADVWEQNCSLGTSVYLPYGIYVIVEQQPQVDALGDFRNKHFRVEKPREVILPAVYAEKDAPEEESESLHAHYRYDAEMTSEQMEREYRIRYQEESRMIEAHGDTGDFAVYPYGENAEVGSSLDGVRTMTGIQTAYDGVYAPMLVPWSLPDNGGDGSSCQALVRFHNRRYRAGFRLEKLDAGTHENLLHDRAVFRIYKAKRNETHDGSGEVLFYEEPTMVVGTEAFLTAIKADNIRPAARNVSLWQRLFSAQSGPGNLYTGIAAAGTPVCEEKDLVVMDCVTQAQEYGYQTVGFLETLRQLDAGAYVICEVTPPAGYVRSNPIAVEVYSDKVAYYKEGNRDCRVLAALYDAGTEARIYVENEPIQLQVEKKKESDQKVTYRVYGTLEYLQSRKAAGEQIEIVYEGKDFSGYGYVTRERDISDQENPYVANALMTLYEALELKPTGDTEDYAYEGLTVERNTANQVTRMYVREGYAGEKTVYTESVTRPDTDILYFALDSLSVTETCMVNGQMTICGYDRNHRKIPLSQMESDRQLYGKTDAEHSAYVFRKGLLYLEITGGDFTRIRYDRKNKILRLGEGTRVYHLDREGNRDALVDPYTGMAYVLAEDGRVLVWPVNVHRDEFGSVISRDKLQTTRIATIDENQEEYYEKEILEVENPSGHAIPASERPEYEHVESGYLTGSWTSEGTEGSHKEKSLNRSASGRNLNDEVLLHENSGSFSRSMNPDYDEHGLTVCYPNSGRPYEKGTALYDRNDDFVRYQDSDHLESYNQAAWELQEPSVLYDSKSEQEQPVRTPLYHRLGESYVLENTWVTAERTPNDPFREERTEGQPDILKRIPAGTYIMEEIRSPEGYLKGMPMGILVREQGELQKYEMTDRTTKAEFGKLDGTDGNRMVPGACLALFRAEKVSTADIKNYPKGYYLRKTETEPYVQWITDNLPYYRERLPQGCYILEEQEVPGGFVRAEPMEVVIENTSEVQSFTLYEEHTRVEIEKYEKVGEEKKLLPGAGFALYPAVLDETGNVCYENGSPVYHEEQRLDSWVSSDCAVYRDFIPAFEAMYRDYGAMEDTGLSWKSGGRDHYARSIQVERSEEGTQYPVYAVLMMRTDDGSDIRIVIRDEYQNRTGIDFVFEYQFEYQKLPQINDYAASWLTLDGVHRLDYLPAGGRYVLVETSAPDGYAKAENRLIEVRDTAEVQRCSVENRTGKLVVSKTSSISAGELPGAHLALYRAGADGSLIMESAYLVTDWISGSDGYYTEQDYIHGQIPEGYRIGDLRPHEIRRLNRGDYWLAELGSPSYYQSVQPLKIRYGQETEIQTVRVENVPVTGSLFVRKTDESGEKLLAGAVFELRAYRKDGSIPVLVRRMSDIGGNLRAVDLPVGEADERGRVIPYRYELCEIMPPDGYAVGDVVYQWEFDETCAEAEYTVRNQRTKLRIGKKTLQNFSAAGADAFVPGAGLAVYELLGHDEQGQPVFDLEHPLTLWITDTEESYHLVEGLVAGRSYLLKEWYVPAGYHEMSPIMFTVSADGRGIARMTDQISTVEIHTASDAQKLTVTGRYVQKTVYELENSEGKALMTWTGNGDAVVIEREAAEKTGLKEGEVCRITEKTFYSDGTRAVTGRTTRRLWFREEHGAAVARIPARMAICVKLTLEQADGSRKQVWYPKQNQTEFTIQIKPVGQEEPYREEGLWILLEETVFDDGTRLESRKLGFDLREAESVRQLTAADRQTEIRIVKTDYTEENYLPGNHLCIRNPNGAELADWISDHDPYVLTGILEEGETYLLEELGPAKGYTRAEKIPFEVGTEGIPEQVLMVNKAVPEAAPEEAPSKPGGGSGEEIRREPAIPVPVGIPAFPFGQKKTGTISASYQPGPIWGRTESGQKGESVWLRFLPYLGDESEPILPVMGFVLSVVGILWCRKKKRIP